VTVELLPLLGPLAALAAPLLVYLAARGRLQHDGKRGHAEDERTLWARMAEMVDRYGERADKLEERLKRTERAAARLESRVTRLQGMVRRWREYALALARQMEVAGMTPVRLEAFGLSLEDDLDDDDEDGSRG